MSKIYRNQKSGTVVASGIIKGISEDRMCMTIACQEYDRNTKQSNEVVMEAITQVPYGDEYRVGFAATAVGYPRGTGKMSAESVMIGNDYVETNDLAIVSGLVKFATYRDEMNADGTPKLNQKQEPKKPHFDITISVKEDDKYVDHVVKVYDRPVKEGEKSEIEKCKARFANFDRETNRVRATIVTRPGTAYVSTVQKGDREYVNNAMSHMGITSMDLDYIDKERAEKSKGDAQPAKAAEPAPQEAPVNEPASGFDAPAMDLEAEQEFV